MYALVIDGYLTDVRGSLTEVLAQARGCGNATVARLDPDGWRVVVRHAGSDVGPLEHVPTGRRVRRRRTTRARLAWLAGQQADRLMRAL